MPRATLKGRLLSGLSSKQLGIRFKQIGHRTILSRLNFWIAYPFVVAPSNGEHIKNGAELYPVADVVERAGSLHSASTGGARQQAANGDRMRGSAGRMASCVFMPAGRR